MGIKSELKSWFNLLRFRLGIMGKEEVIDALLPERERLLKKLPQHERAELRDLLHSVDNLGTISNFGTWVPKMAELQNKLERLQVKYDPEYAKLAAERKEKVGYTGGMDAGFALQGTNSWQYFVTPFALMGYFADNHWAVRSAIDFIMQEVQHDDYRLDYPAGADPKDLIDVKKRLRQAKIHELRMWLLENFLVYKNAMLLPHFDALGNFIKLERLITDNVMPVFDNGGIGKVMGWEVWRGYHSEKYYKEQVLHLFSPSLKFPDLGCPILAPMSTDLETDLACSVLNHTVVNKAGMIGLVIALKDPEQGVNSREMEKTAKRIKGEIQNEHSGYKNPYGVFVSNWIEKVFKLTDIGKFDASFGRSRDMVASGVATRYRIPLSWFNIGSKSKGVYEAFAVRSGGSEQLDKAIHAHMRVVDSLINEYILPLYGIYGVKIVANGRWGSLNLNGARASLAASQAGPLFTRNEHRCLFFGAEPQQGPEGDEYIDTSIGRNVHSLPAEQGPPSDYLDQSPHESFDDAVDDDPEDLES